MCDQTEVIYSPGDVVWVKLGPVWWPGQVYDYDKLPEEITSNLRKKPIAVVKFFQEDSYEYVKNLNSIYHYDCRRKHEFIKKGLDMCRSNSRDVPSNMKMFPNDIVTAEHLTNGNPNILNSEEFAPEEKEDYSELFGKKTPKKSKIDSAKKDISSWRLKSVSESSFKSGRRSLPTPIIPRPITHPRFITKALEGRSDHEVRIRQQVHPSGSRNSGNSDKQYNCHLCGFSSSRINVIVLHNKSHSAGYADAYLPPQQSSGKGRKIKSERKMVYSSEKRQRVSDVFKSDEPPPKRKSVKIAAEVNILSGSVTSDKNGKSVDVPGKSKQIKKPVFGRKKSAKDKAEKLAKEKQQNDAFRETLLKDWDEDEDNEEDKADASKDNLSKDKENSVDSSLNLSDKPEGDSSKRKEISCFDFDDSEDGLNIGETVMKFGQKIPRVFGDKPKKQTKNTVDENSMDVESPSGNKVEVSSDELSSKSESNNQTLLDKNAEKRKSEESKAKETEDLQSAFKSLLDETAVPVIPDAPSLIEIKKKSVDLETSLHHPVRDDDDDDDGGGGEVDVDTGGGIKESETVECGKGTVAIETKIEVNEVVSESVIEETESSSVKIAEDVQSISDGEHKEVSYVSTEHFLVKTSEEVATSSSDEVKLERSVSPNEKNVAESKSETKVNCVRVEGGEDSSRSLKNSDITGSVSEEPTKFETENTSKTVLSASSDSVTNVSNGTEENLSSGVVIETEQGKIHLNKNNFSAVSVTAHEDVTEHPPTPSEAQNKSSVASEGNNFQEMDFDINSMPVIISEDMVQSQENIIPSVNNADSFSASKVPAIRPDVNSACDSKLITVKNVTKQVTLDSGTGSNLTAIFKEEVSSGSLATPHGKDSKASTRKVLLSPTKTVATSRSPQVATIKVQPSSSVATKLTVPGGIISQKNVGSTSQVLILKSAIPGQPGKSTLQKISNTSQMIQQGGKVLILTNPQGAAGQSKVLSSLSTQQKTLSSNKLTGTRILTTKGTVLTTGSQGAISKANILSGSSKTVTTKSGQKILINKGGVISQTPKSVIINKSGVLTTVNSPAIVSNKGSLITQNILTNKAEVAATSQISSPQITVSSKGATATILTSPGFTAGKSMILAPVSSNKGVSLGSSQKLRLITTSKASPACAATGSGTKLMIQSSPSRMILPSSSLAKNQQLKLVGNLKGQSSTSTILIQTSQGVIATTPLTSSQMGNKNKVTKSSLPTVISTALSPNKPTAIQVAQPIPQSQNKLIVQKVKPSGPNILQKTQKKPIQRSSKKTVTNQLTSASSAQSIQTARTPVTVSPLTSAEQDTLILSPNSGLPVVGQSNVVHGSQLDPSNQTALVYLTVDESGNYRPLESTPVVNYEGTTADSQTLYIDPGTTDLDNIFLAIDDAGNVVNISQPVQSTFTTESSTPPPSQDILAKALANTQVLQQETIATENIPLSSSVESSMLSGCMFVEPQTQYPQPSLSHSVLETSLTLNQPIMTPLEVPSAVSPRSLDPISSLQTGFLSDSTLLTTTTCASKEKKANIHPSMPLLTEESDSHTASGSVDNKNETVFFTQVGVDGSHTVLTPVTSGSQLAFQLALDENNVIVSSTGVTSLGVISSSSMPQSSLTYLPHSELSDGDKKPLLNVINSNTSSAVFASVSQESSIDERYHLADKQLNDGRVKVSNDNASLRNISSENVVLGLPESSVVTSEAFETKDEIVCIKNENIKGENVLSDVDDRDSAAEEIETPVQTHNETLMTSVSEGVINNVSSVSCNELSVTKTTGSYSGVGINQIVIDDERATILNTPADGSIDNEQAVSKTDTVGDIKEESFRSASNCLTIETTVTNGNGDIAQGGKRHLEDITSPSDDSNIDIETKKIKLDDER